MVQDAGSSRPGGAADALVVFGVTGDLSYKKIFPALHNLARRGRLGIPVIGVARGDRTDEWLHEHARQSIAEHGADVDDAATTEVVKSLVFVPGDYQDKGTFERLQAALGDAQ